MANTVQTLRSPVATSGRGDRLGLLRSVLRGEACDLPAWAEPLRPYLYHFLIIWIIPTALFLDIHTQNIMQQNLLGLMSFSVLWVSTRYSAPDERRQVWIMVGIATCVEIWSSVIWGVYRYRFDNMPLFVPWGHGMVYLFALRAGRTPLLQRYGQWIARVAFVMATCWAIGGITIEPILAHRVDLLGVIFWPIFAWFMRTPNSPIFAAAFLVTAYLELIGTGFGNWTWQIYAPVSHIPSGNPPSVISAGYCLMDFMSIQVAAMLPATLLGWRPRWMARQMVPIELPVPMGVTEE